MRGKIILAMAAISAALIVSGYQLTYFGQREPVTFYSGHTHTNFDTQGAPQHSGGTDAYGCHNGSVPYHCH